MITTVNDLIEALMQQDGNAYVVTDDGDGGFVPVEVSKLLRSGVGGRSEVCVGP